MSNNLDIVIDGHDVTALVDTGADYSVLSGKFSRLLRKVTTQWDGPDMRTAGGHTVAPIGLCTARVEINGEAHPVKFLVLENCSRDVILGIDFLSEYGAVIDLGTNRLTLRKPAPLQENLSLTSAPVRVVSDHVKLPPRSSVFLSLQADMTTTGEALLEGSVQLLLEKGVGIARGIAQLHDGRVEVLVTNFRDEPQHLTKGMAIAYLEGIADSTADLAATELTKVVARKQDMTAPLEVDVNRKLSPSERHELSQLLDGFRDCFAGPSGVGRTRCRRVTVETIEMTR